MPASLNKVFIIGNLTRDPELRYIPSGQAVTTFTIAVNRTYVGQNGEKKEETNFLRVVTWGKRAEVCNEYLRKGSSVFVEGRLQGRSWTAQDGSKRSTIEISAQNVQFLSRASGRAREGVDVAARKPDKEMIIDDSFTPQTDAQPMNIPAEELSPDNDVPF